MRSRYKTARCVLRCDNRFFLAVHSSFWARKTRRWGLPGGGIERREDPHDAARRELGEELELYLPDLTPIGAYSYKGHEHMVYGADIEHQVDRYDDNELLEIGWFTLDHIQRFARESKLHAGYELQAIHAYLALEK